MSSHIDRLRAQEQLEQLDVMTVAQAMGDSDARSEFREHLRERLGTVVRRKEKIRRSSHQEILSIVQEF